MIKTLSSIVVKAVLVRTFLVSLFLLIGIDSVAQQAEEAKPPTVAPEQETTPAKESKPEPPIATQTKNKDDRPPDIFVPSEEISEDLSVSFPEDI